MLKNSYFPFGPGLLSPLGCPFGPLYIYSLFFFLILVKTPVRNANDPAMSVQLHVTMKMINVLVGL